MLQATGRTTSSSSDEFEVRGREAKIQLWSIADGAGATDCLGDVVAQLAERVRASCRAAPRPRSISSRGRGVRGAVAGLGGVGERRVLGLAARAGESTIATAVARSAGPGSAPESERAAAP